mmetsp:Transcript_39523/g.85322  ORF Transcript_39523/g.85322 Transcript_39523/m.85322 type:complete len:334 (+) Transcript_39523:50-1051(+)
MEKSFVEKCLHSIEVNGRHIEYAVSGEETGEPVLLFYPLGASRSIVAVFHGPATRVGVRLICINRPGMGQASPTHVGSHIEVHCQDVVSCLDHLGIHRVRLLFLCAGAPFALGFQARYPHRSHGRLVGCSSWVSPSDCPSAKFMYQVGAGLPSSLLASLADAMVGWTRSMPSSSSGYSNWAFTSFLPSSSMRLSQPAEVKVVPVLEQKACADSQAEVDILMERCASLLMEQETGGEGPDAATLVESAKAWGVDYRRLGCSMVLLHGDADVTVPVDCVEWLQEQIPKTVLHRIPDAEHGEAMLLSISVALRLLIPSCRSCAEASDVCPLEVMSL